MYSIDDLDVKKSCEIEHEFEVKSAAGKGTGLFLSVIGDHAQRIEDFTKQQLNARRVADANHEKRDPRGKTPNVHLVEEDIEFSTELVALRVVGWRGLKEPYSHAAAVKLCTINPEIKEQILAASSDMKNFPTPFSTNSASTSDTTPG